MNLVYHVYIREQPNQVEYSTLSVNRKFLAKWMSDLDMNYQIELKLGIL